MKTSISGQVSNKEVEILVKEYVEKKTGRKVKSMRPDMSKQSDSFGGYDLVFEGYRFELEGELELKF